ncbi:MAG: hypothetical protein ORN26_00910 [Candidatus Pacebacteria bacterium]|nr:hypothetical protein [Candidatus Paceibacterota bacterium]
MNGDEQYNSPLLYYGFFGGNRNEEGWIWRSWYFETYFFSKNTNEYYTPERKDI